MNVASMSAFHNQSAIMMASLHPKEERLHVANALLNIFLTDESEKLTLEMKNSLDTFNKMQEKLQ